MPRCNLIALGEQRVGKTSLLCLLTGGEFVKDRDPTRGIHNEKVDVTSMNVCSQTWKEVKSEEIAKHNDMYYAASIVEEFKPKFDKNKTDEVSPPNLDQLKKVIKDIETHLKEIERAAKDYTAKPLTPTPRPKISAQPQRKSSDSLAPAQNSCKPVVTTESVTESKNFPTTHGKSLENAPLPSMPKLDTSKGKKSKPQPLPKRSEPLQSRPDAIKKTNVDHSTSKAIVSEAKRRSDTVTEPVLQFNSLDFAGQSDYRAMHHCFIVRRAIYLVVFNLQVLRDALKDTTQATQRALEEIQYWMNSIHAHIHKMGPEPLRRVMLVGTHCCPKEGSTKHPQPPITDEQLHQIDKKLQEIFEGSPVINNIFKTSETWIAPIENSLDGDKDRENSGAAKLQRAIHDAWNELPFKKEVYPTTWLRFEAYLQRRQQSGEQIEKAVIIKEAGREQFGIGEENEGDIEMALGFFHDTGTIVYPRKCLLFT